MEEFILADNKHLDGGRCDYYDVFGKNCDCKFKICIEDLKKSVFLSVFHPVECDGFLFLAQSTTGVAALDGRRAPSFRVTPTMSFSRLQPSLLKDIRRGKNILPCYKVWCITGVSRGLFSRFFVPRGCEGHAENNGLCSRNLKPQQSNFYSILP